jgi:chorismate mutase
MSLENIKRIKDWGLGIEGHMIVSGPCSAETEEQVLSTAREVAKDKRINVLRAGIWKPRTRPGSFEGIGEIGLDWLNKAKAETGLLTATEVANASHVEACLKAGIDILWVGARTTVNPFSVQEVADALKGVDIPVLVKNPINPDLGLWQGGLERIASAGITRLGAIHRGFSTYEKTPFRNLPKWDMAIEMMRKFPQIDIINDPSHIAGNRELLPYVCQKAIDLNMEGLMIESHISPSVAWSDAAQQVTPGGLTELLDSLTFRQESVETADTNKLDSLRKEIDELDDDIFQKIASRMNISDEIGKYKRDNSVTILQVDRWEEIVNKRISLGVAMGLDDNFVKNYLKLIHKESIRRQNLIMNKVEAELAGK